MKYFISVIALLATVMATQMAQANFYLHPRAGLTISTGGDSRYTLGMTGGYRWTPFLSTELSYARLFGNSSSPDGDLIEADVRVGFPLGPLHGFASGGVGTIHTVLPGEDLWKNFIDFGTGLGFSLGPLGLSAGVTYAIVIDGEDFVGPYLSAGLSF
ncbi:MAG: hypothetical protein KDD52_04800 [Bdellovibrionales bacterium]|nr:hypothetical protein [Bdellovibrionales bacterium]